MLDIRCILPKWLKKEIVLYSCYLTNKNRTDIALSERVRDILGITSQEILVVRLFSFDNINDISPKNLLAKDIVEMVKHIPSSLRYGSQVLMANDLAKLFAM